MEQEIENTTANEGVAETPFMAAPMPVIQFVVFNEATGRISGYGYCDEDSVLLQGSGVITTKEPFPDAFDVNFYVKDGVITERQKIDGVQAVYDIVANGTDEVAFTLPEGTVIRFQGENHTGEEDFVFSTDLPGAYEFKIKPPPAFLDTTVIVNAV